MLYNAAFVGAAAVGAVMLPNTGWSRGTFAALAAAYLVGALLYWRAPSAPAEPARDAHQDSSSERASS